MARTHKTTGRDREIRTAKEGSARDAIGELTPGVELYIMTYGHFSLIDALTVLLEQTGPADVVLSTWTAANADLTAAAKLLEHSRISSMRFIVDRSFLSRQPAYCAHMRDLFGDECIRTARTHAKFAAIHNDDWHLAVRTSMNLNENPRLENIEISDDPDLCDFLLSVADDLYQEQHPGVLDGHIPLLANVEGVTRAGAVRMGKASCSGRTASIGPRT